MALKKPQGHQECGIDRCTPQLSCRPSLDNTLEELNVLCTKTSKTTEESQEGAEQDLLESDLCINTKTWNREEVKTLFSLYKELGSRWTMIAKMIDGKPENSIKNKFNCSIRKFTRKLNKINKEAHTQFRKQIRTESIFRIIEATQLFPNMEAEMKKRSLEIRAQILVQAEKQQDTTPNENIVELIDAINSFNLKTRSHKNPKHKRRKDIILFEPAKQFSDCCAEQLISYAKADVEENLKKGVQIQMAQQISPQDSMQMSTNLNIFENEPEGSQNNLMVPLDYDPLGDERRNCFWSNALNHQQFSIQDEDLWFSGLK